LFLVFHFRSCSTHKPQLKTKMLFEIIFEKWNQYNKTLFMWKKVSPNFLIFHKKGCESMFRCYLSLGSHFDPHWICTKLLLVKSLLNKQKEWTTPFFPLHPSAICTNVFFQPSIYVKKQYWTRCVNILRY
jgi:hypothetical protein